MKKLLIAILLFMLFVQPAWADDVIDKGINFLKSKQDSTGKITGGFSAPSQWAAIAFSANGVEIGPLKNFLLSDLPTKDTATEWENRILALVAIGENPASLVSKLESFYSNSQIGELCALNDDIFGLLALIASGNNSKTQIKQAVLSYIISKQDADGGFGWSAPGCPYYETSADMSAAAIQALQAAKDNNLIDSGLDSSIAKAKNYLLTHQNSDNGFGYFGSSDADTTGWVLMAMNVLGLKEASQSAAAKQWLISKQNQDGGFPGYSGSDSTTTAQALTALSGKGWILKIASVSAAPISTPSAIPAPTSAPTPKPTSSPTLTPSPVPVPTPSSIPSLSSSPAPTIAPIIIVVTPKPSLSPSPAILGINKKQVITTQIPPDNSKKILFSIFSFLNFAGAALYWRFKW